jgi:DNA-binding transcriptional MocR family regulator
MLVELPRSTHMRLSFGLADPDQIREGVRRLGRTIRSFGAANMQRRSVPVT